MKQIETYHDKLHEIYGNVYDIFFVNPEKRSLLYKIMTFNSKKVSSSDKKRADEYLIQMQEISKEFLRLITKLEKAIKGADLIVLQRLSNSAV